MFNLRPIPFGSKHDIEPIFVVGAGRSGTTPLQLALNMHPKLGIYGETQAFFVHRKFGAPSTAGNLRRLLEYWRLVIEGCCPYADLFDNSEIETSLANAPTYADVLDLVIGAIAAREGKQRWGEKTPAHVFKLREIRSCFPNARIIHIVRDPRAVVCSSIRAFRRAQFTDWNIFAATKYWVRCLEVHEKEVSKRSDRYMLVQYEDFVTRPEATLLDICSFLNVEFVGDMLSAHRMASRYIRPDKSGLIPPLHALTQEPLNPQRTEAWKEVLSADQSRLIERIAGTHMAKLGYSITRKKYAPPQMGVSYLMTRWTVNEGRRVAAKQMKDSAWALRRAFNSPSNATDKSNSVSTTGHFSKEGPINE